MPPTMPPQCRQCRQNAATMPPQCRQQCRHAAMPPTMPLEALYAANNAANAARHAANAANHAANAATMPPQCRQQCRQPVTRSQTVVWFLCVSAYNSLPYLALGILTAPSSAAYRASLVTSPEGQHRDKWRTGELKVNNAAMPPQCRQQCRHAANNAATMPPMPPDNAAMPPCRQTMPLEALYAATMPPQCRQPCRQCR